MKITLIYDNTVYKPGLKADWGFSALIEKDNLKILFDTGAKGTILLNNMEKLNIKPESIDEVFISHSHWDHTGGLSHFLKINKTAKVYIPRLFYLRAKNREVIKIKQSLQMHEGIFSTGTLKHIEQSMAIKMEKGLVVIAGCSHPGVGNILDAVSQFGKPYILIGGLHGFREFDIITNLEKICACHCTQHQAEIKALYPEKWIEGGVGRIIET
ncbi:MAG: MBL fold metallo-hydrolase [Candidatus Cloacimonadota bacterium]|nr:MBL fold metallo-hydrolase [Candidatus Cloacimonadota bacterium]